jgi:hypothetical protein
MSGISKLAVPVAAAMAFATFVSASAFADSRHRDETWRDQNRGPVVAQKSVTMEGRIRSVDRERDGYRVQLDRGGYSYFVPESAYRSWRGRAPGIELRAGINIRLSGLLDPRGYVYVSNADWIDDSNDYNDRYDNNRGQLRGIVQDVDVRRGIAVIRDENSGRQVTVAMRRSSERGVDLNDIHRGDRVTFEGDWTRGIFEARRIESVRSGR